MSVGSCIDRAINAALIAAAEAANRLMTLTYPIAQPDMAALLTRAEADTEVWEPQTCDASGPPAVDGDAPPAGAGSASAGTDAGTGGHPIRSTSELLEDAARRIGRFITPYSGADLTQLVADLRDRAAQFSAHND